MQARRVCGVDAELRRDFGISESSTQNFPAERRVSSEILSDVHLIGTFTRRSGADHGPVYPGTLRPGALSSSYLRAGRKMYPDTAQSGALSSSYLRAGRRPELVPSGGPETTFGQVERGHPFRAGSGW